MSSRKTTKVRKSDYDRVVITETIPVEVPLFFSNYGLYQWARAHRKDLEKSKAFGHVSALDLVEKLVDPKRTKKNQATRPYEYQVRVRVDKDRKLALPHPRNQNRWVDLYHDRHELMVHFCRRSPYSLRAPSRVASRTFISNVSQEKNLLRLKKVGVEVDVEQYLHRHAVSFFSYSGYQRLHKFFDSDEFLRLERRFSKLWMLDISNCFGSIYTHSLSWAVTSKEHVKRNLGSKSFGAEMDREISAANWNETNGILVGPEFSRIFAEIILQDVDLAAIGDIRFCEEELEGRFAIRRYVDDYFIFAADNVVAERVAHFITKHLQRYNLALNEQKTIRLCRPFITERSRAIELARRLLSDFVDLTSKSREIEVIPPPKDDLASPAETKQLSQEFKKPQIRRLVVPRPIRSVRRVKAAILRRIKSICAGSDIGYGLVSGYCISAIANHITRLCEATEVENNEAVSYRNAFQLMLDLLYFLYSVSPTVEHSVKLANASLLTLRFFEQASLKPERTTVEETVFRGCTSFLQESAAARPAHAETGLEILNIVTVVGQLSNDHEIPWRIMQRWIGADPTRLEDLDYFATVVLLQYAGRRPDYEEVRRRLGEAIEHKLDLADKTTVASSSEFAHLILDALSCPFLEYGNRKRILLEACHKMDAKKPNSNREVQGVLDWMRSHPWFTDWDDISLFRSLERRLRAKVY